LNEVPLSILFGILALLIVFSGFFSSSETGMMSLNRYRLRHLTKNKHKAATRASKLLEKPDRLIGTILTGNNLVNFAAAALATIISQRLWPDNPDLAVFVNTILFTLVVLIFAELTPKTLAAVHPEKVAFPASRILAVLQWLLLPFVWFVNTIANGLLKIFKFDVNSSPDHHLNTEELRTVVNEAGGMIPKSHQQMLISILDLENMAVNDIMVPRSEVVGIDLEDDIDTITEILRTTEHTRLPVYKGELNNVIGVLHTRNASKFLTNGSYTKTDMLEVCREPYFIPESTPLHTQLMNFQKKQRRISIVVDEYGDIQGICTLEDILEEIVGEFTTDISDNSPDYKKEKGGSYLIDGTAYIRDINKGLDWDLPIDGPKTISGLIIEYLEAIPENSVCLKLNGYKIEVTKIQDKMVKMCRVFPAE